MVLGRFGVKRSPWEGKGRERNGREGKGWKRDGKGTRGTRTPGGGEGSPGRGGLPPPSPPSALGRFGRHLGVSEILDAFWVPFGSPLGI